MAEVVVNGQADPKGLPICAIFSLDWLVRPEHRSAVVSRVLNQFPNLPENARKALRSAVNDEIIPTTGGFRRGQAGRALDGLRTILQDPIEREIKLSAKLASAVFRCWAESHSSLKGEVERHLTIRGLTSPGPDLSEKAFCGVWPLEQWKSEQEAFSNSHDGFEQDDIALMLCYVSGNIPLEPEPDSDAEGPQDVLGGDLLSDILAYLRELPATSTEWEREIPNFAASVSRLIEEKAAQLRWSADFDAILEAIRREFAELIAFFEWDTDRWAAARVSAEADTAAVLRLAERLQTLLAEYRPVHERALGISEERERSQKRAELQPVILDTLNEIDGLMTEDLGSQDDGPPVQPEPDPPIAAPYLPVATNDESPSFADTTQTPTLLPGPVAEQPAPELEPPLANSLQEAHPASGESVPAERPVAVAEPPGFTASEYAALRSDNHGMRDTATALRSENQDLRDEVEILKSVLYDSQEMEESWRLAYLSSKGRFTEAAPDEALEIENVNAAVEMAKERFRRQLAFAPNSESNVEDNPYSRPEKVWEALQWLATTYYQSKMGSLRVTNFDQSIKEACGWWYKGDQGETTLSRYRKSYTANVYGKTYWLAEHIGKGTNFDSRYTIRIAFNWDDDLRQVIIGYIGRHQQTDAS